MSNPIAAILTTAARDAISTAKPVPYGSFPHVLSLDRDAPEFHRVQRRGRRATCRYLGLAFPDAAPLQPLTDSIINDLEMGNTAEPSSTPPPQYFCAVVGALVEDADHFRVQSWCEASLKDAFAAVLAAGRKLRSPVADNGAPEESTAPRTDAIIAYFQDRQACKSSTDSFATCANNLPRRIDLSAA
ncbi:hypothetical protein DFH09DRAFT_1085643 [Mycena vulgaris]|nr:hypothetical protein DFH09DRAFT_1113963 [Mycena vulgaris]KAJ6553518.1 hypothetical protein DFH09DRAFT_1085643 [Mycena vulgaris]